MTRFFSRESIITWAPGQFWIVVILVVGLAAFPAYRYAVIPGEEQEKIESAAKLLAQADSTNIYFRFWSIGKGTPVASADSAYHADQQRAMQMMLNQMNARTAAENSRPIYLLASIILLLWLAWVAWTWFGRNANEVKG